MKTGILTALAFSLGMGVMWVRWAPAYAGNPAKAIDDYRFRQQVVERLTNLEAFQHKDGQTQARLFQLERKVTGMQTQITRLHAINAAQDKEIDNLSAAVAKEPFDPKVTM